jgi:excisionase family DNA binding protein
MSKGNRGAVPKLDFESILDALADRIATRLESAQVSDTPGAVAPRLLTVEQAASYIGRTKASVQHMVADGALPCVRSDRRVFLDRQDLDRWIEQNKSPEV